MADRSKVERLRISAKEAIAAQDALLDAWRALRESDSDSEWQSNDVEFLRQLMRRCIYTINAFGILVRLDKSAALSELLSKYVGQGVSPDTKFGGYTFELRAMLDDLYECHGEAALRALIRDPEFNHERLNDRRVVDSFAWALDIEESEFSRWLGNE